MNALDLLIKDHRYQEEILSKLKIATQDERRELYQQFREELIKHVNIEEEIFYPRLKKIPNFESRVLEALEEHNLCMQLLQELDQENDDKVWEAKLSVLETLTRHHVREEEDELFGEVRELASEEYLKDMGSQMKYHKKNTDPEKVLYPEK